MRVDSTDPAVRRLIASIADLVTTSGGFVHPSLVVHHEGASLWTSLPRSKSLVGATGNRMGDGPRILRIPRALHVPVHIEEWPDDSVALRPPSDLSGLSDVQLRLGLLMVELFNACDKVRSVGASYPNIALVDDPDLHSLISEGRPRWARLRPVSPSRNFLQSRLGTDGWATDGGAPPHLMPMIDLMNHHPDGARYEYDADAVEIRAVRCGLSDEVYLRYHDYDALTIALNLGYLERATRFVASIACRVEVPGIGVVEVEAHPLERRDPPTPAVERSSEGLRLVGFQIGADVLARLRQLLALPLRSRFGLDESRARSGAIHLIRQVAQANRDYFSRMATVSDREGDQFGLRPLFRGVGEHQVDLLDRTLDRVAQGTMRGNK